MIEYIFIQVWTIAVMLLSRKFNKLPHLFALNLFLAQVSLISKTFFKMRFQCLIQLIHS